MMNKKIKWGILGYARIAKLFVIPAIQKSSNSEFYAIASRDEEKLTQCQKEFGNKKAYTNYEALLNDTDIDAVYIPLPNSMHKEWTLKAANKGKHILCEKPLALSKQDAMEMYDTCAKRNVKLMEAFMYRFTNKTKKINEILDSGSLGDIKAIHSAYRFFLNRPNTIKMKVELGGGSLYDVGCYPVNFVGMITGKQPVEMKADCFKKDGVDVSFSAILKYNDGTMASISSGFNSFDNTFSEIIGTKGRLEILETFSDTSSPLILTTEEGSKEILVEPTERYLLEVEHFADAILNNKKLILQPEESIRNMEVIEQLANLISH
jgi:xylose dehydrogenase (NAD/NADP)